MNLLIVNDEKVTAQTMKKEISWEDCGIKEVYLAFDALEAKEQLKTHEIDIMLCDIEMPGENGIELLRWVKEEHIDVECIFLTCHANFDYAREAVKLDCMDYVLIPVPYEEIKESVRKVICRRIEKQEKEQMSRYGEQWVSQKKREVVVEQGEKKSARQIVKECEEYILENLENMDLSVNEAAAYCHLSPIYLNRIFKKENGISISQYIIRERMILAAKLLEEDVLNANMVAIKVGYPSYPHFSFTFKKYYGCSPKQYKENAKK